RIALPQRSRGQVQPATADRGVAGRCRALAGHDAPPGAVVDEPTALMTRLTRPGWIVVGALLILGVMAVFGDNGVLALRRLRGEVDTLVREVRTLEAENERLSRAISE